MKPIINVNIERKGQVVTLVDSQVKIDGQPASVGEVNILTNQQVVQLYDQAISQLRATPETFFDGLDFDNLVIQSKRLIDIKNILEKIRCMNTTSYSNTAEKCREELTSLFRTIFWKYHGNNSAMESVILDDISNGYLGYSTHCIDLNDLFNPMTDDNSAADKLFNDFHSYLFGKYVSQEQSELFKNKFQEIYTTHNLKVDTFRKFRDIAGVDIVNWGPHKFAAQGKKHNLDACYVVQRWADKLSKYLIESGAETKPAKKTTGQKLREKAQAGDALTQADYVKLFKTTHSASAHTVIQNMSIETAVSLLEIETKNVQDKLYTSSRYDGNVSSKSLQVIVDKVSIEYNPSAFEKLKTYFNKKQVYYVTWNLLSMYHDHYSLDDFASWVKRLASGGYSHNHAEIDDRFFSKISQLQESNRFLLHSSVTHAFIQRMSLVEREEFLQAYRNVPKVLRRLGKSGEYALVNWDVSAKLFFDCSYPVIQEFIGEAHSRYETSNFIPAIVKHNDKERAIALLTEMSLSSGREDLFSILNFDEKVKVLKENGRNNYLDINKLFTGNERFEFAKIAVVTESLCHYVNRLDQVDVNKLLQVVPETEYVYVMPEDYLNKDSVLRVLRNGTWDRTYTEHTMLKLYKLISRGEFDANSPVDISAHKDRIILAHLMTDFEKCYVAGNDIRFFQANVSLMPESYIKQFRDKAKFKEVVGDRRNPRNDRFGNALESRLNALKDASA